MCLTLVGACADKLQRAAGSSGSGSCSEAVKGPSTVGFPFNATGRASPSTSGSLTAIHTELPGEALEGIPAEEIIPSSEVTLLTHQDGRPISLGEGGFATVPVAPLPPERRLPLFSASQH